jgi:hypothetical protein
VNFFSIVEKGKKAHCQCVQRQQSQSKDRVFGEEEEWDMAFI